MSRTALAAAALALLSACEPTGSGTAIVAPDPPPEQIVPPTGAPTRSQKSLDLEKFYTRVQADLLSQGLLRTDGGGPDTPFAAHNLVDNFVRIALFDEYVTRGGTLVAQQTESQLRRWERPVRLNVSFGASVPEHKRRHDTAAINSYARRLSRASGHPVTVTGSSANANFHVLILHENERRSYGAELRSRIPGIGDGAVRTIETMPRETFCLVYAFSRGDAPDYTRAVAVIRAEHPDLLRLSCIHEEIAQGMGLANDSPYARPSIFNDDEEFGLLTRHDELLLRILYDRRLTAGMDAEAARPIVTQIADGLVGSGS